ncbi:hypothetical protein B0H11DRAFT_2214103 [Mycena galericulata]|nr:hypothetical protein B0H11DRAFT_2214103 [Mycena galericulata]
MPKNTKSKKKSSKDDDTPPKKRGQPSEFQGSRLAFMTARLDDYMKYSKDHNTRSFWPPFFHAYWREFPWRVPLNEEPPPPPPPPMAVAPLIPGAHAAIESLPITPITLHIHAVLCL